ncbi:hypothetical protein OAO01_06745 [Oligoflexia bacterium]|nr:hypothetical protein [Oligoflexia bacterium]
MYETEEGFIKEAPTLDKVPEVYRDSPKTRCVPVFKQPKVKRQLYLDRTAQQRKGNVRSAPSAGAGAAGLAKPSEIKLKGTKRRENMASSVGRIELRWPRSVELVFGRTPKRAMADAARTVSRALKKSGFPPALQKLDIDWQIVFMDSELPDTQIPASLINNCHPGWMTPPSNIYIVGQRVAGGCGGQQARRSVADSRLAEVIIHEMGHAVEHHLLQKRFSGDRLRIEGFATWFQVYASEFSAVISSGSVRDKIFQSAKTSIRKNPNSFSFSGTAEDYARASLYFHAVVKYHGGVRSLMKVYDAMRTERLNFFDAVDKKLNWSRAKLEEKAAKVVGVRL